MNLIKNFTKLSISAILLSVTIGFMEGASQLEPEINKMGIFLLGLSITSLAMIFV
jgi:hypothetical protein